MSEVSFRIPLIYFLAKLWEKAWKLQRDSINIREKHFLGIPAVNSKNDLKVANVAREIFNYFQYQS
jgi:hypothetical protein